MGEWKEVVFLSDEAGTIQCVNPRIGTVLKNYRGLSSVKKNCVAVLGKNYLLAAESSKPILSVWELNSEQQLSGPKLTVAGKPSAVGVSPSGAYCAVAVEGKIYVNQPNNGALLGVLTKHVLGVTKILFLGDGAHFVSCGENGAVYVWNIATAVPFRAEANDGSGEPLYSFNHHALPVTDACASSSGIKGRLYTCSLDQTLKIYNLRDGTLLLNVTFEESLTAIRHSILETVIYLGTTQGQVLRYSLDPLPRTLNYQPAERDSLAPFEGHTKAVTSLEISFDAFLLFSGSEDGTVSVWYIPSGQVIRVFTLKAPIASIILTKPYKNIFTPTFKADAAFEGFKRPGTTDEDFTVNVISKETITAIDYFKSRLVPEECFEEVEKEPAVEELKEELARTKKKNHELYQFAMKTLLEPRPRKD